MSNLPPPPNLGASSNAIPRMVGTPAPTYVEEQPSTLPSGQQAVPSPSRPEGDMEKGIIIVNEMFKHYDKKMVGQQELKKNLFITLLAGGHILLESVPGLAKTTAAHALASTVNASFNRIQCTPDLLPSDIVGTQVYNQNQGSFTTELGPVHAHFVLLDEINRSSAKTQSAMLEAMQERQTSIGGVVYKLPDPFLVIATQNPIEQEGTYHLPEAQLDRFLLKDVLTYPKPEDELDILARLDNGSLKIDDNAHESVVTVEDLKFLQELTKTIYVDETIRQYIINVVHATRFPEGFVPSKFEQVLEYGGSPRASIAFLNASRALALLNGRTHVIPEDIKDLRHSVLRHRLILSYEADVEGITPEMIIDEIFNTIPVP